MRSDFTRIDNVVTKIKDIETLLEWLDKYKVYVRVGHSSHTYDVSQFVDAGLADILKSHMHTNLKLRRASLVGSLHVLSSEVKP